MPFALRQLKARQHSNHAIAVAHALRLMFVTVQFVSKYVASFNCPYSGFGRSLVKDNAKRREGYGSVELW